MRRRPSTFFPESDRWTGRASWSRAGNAAEQVKQALGNLRLLASRIGVLPAHFVTVTIYGADNSLRESLEKSAREVFSDSGPASAFVAAKNLRLPGAMVEVEAVAVVRGSKPGK